MRLPFGRYFAVNKFTVESVLTKVHLKGYFCTLFLIKTYRFMRNNYLITTLLLVLLLGAACRSFQKIRIEKEKEERESMDGKTEPYDLFSFERSYPDRDFDWQGWRKSIQQVRQNEAQVSAERSSCPGQSLNWTLQGASNVAGRVNSLAIQPGNESVVLAGFAGGGIFKSTDGGTNWIPVLTTSLNWQSATSPSTRAIPMSFTPAPATPISLPSCSTATVCTKAPTPATPGPTWDWANRVLFQKYWSTPPTPTTCTSPQWATRTYARPTAGSTKVSTAGKPGSKCSTPAIRQAPAT